MELKPIIKETEDRVSNYKDMLEKLHKDKINFPPDDEFVILYKNLLRENKNSEELWLKRLVEEKTFENSGLNPPFCYLYNKK